VQEEERDSEWKLPGAGLWLGRTGNVRVCVRRNREREREGRAASLRVVVVGGWVSAARMGADCREILIAPVRAARQPTPGDARTFVVNERTPDYVVITGVRRL
jgi:hypothetical protein